MSNYYQLSNDYLNQRLEVKGNNENTYTPPANAIDDADRASFWNKYDLTRIKLIGKIKRSRR